MNLLLQTQDPKQAICKRYCRKLGRALACLPELRNRTVAQMSDSIYTYLEEHPDANYNQLVQVFGTPKQAAESLLNELDSEQVRKAINHYRWKHTLAVVLIGIVIACVVWVVGNAIAYMIGSLIEPPYAIETIRVYEYVEVDEPMSLPPTIAK